jgi:hypothetical protein
MMQDMMGVGGMASCDDGREQTNSTDPTLPGSKVR